MTLNNSSLLQEISISFVSILFLALSAIKSIVFLCEVCVCGRLRSSKFQTVSSGWNNHTHFSGTIKKLIEINRPSDIKNGTIANTDGLINWLRRARPAYVGLGCLLQPGLLLDQSLKSMRENSFPLIKFCCTRTDPAAKTKSIGLQVDALARLRNGT